MELPVNKTDIAVYGISGEEIPPQLIEALSTQPSAIACSTANYRLLQQKNALNKQLPWINLVPLKQCLDAIEELISRGTVIVVTSGDPLFYGIGRLLNRTFNDRAIVYHPSLSAMQLCFSRFKIRWDDTEHVSVHGRNLNCLDKKIYAAKLFILTDGENSPRRIAHYIRSRLAVADSTRCRMHVGENLGTAQERLVSGSLEEIAATDFESPNCLIFINDNEPDRNLPRFGLTENHFQHSRGLITKNEVRAAVLHALALPDSGVFWDVGAGSGSVSIEAARMCPGLSVYSIEKVEKRVADIVSNRERFRCYNMDIIRDEAPVCLENLPRPDRVFIGGSGGRLTELIDYFAEETGHETLLVFTAVTEKTAEEAPRLLFERGYSVAMSRIETTRIRYPDLDRRVLNPIYIIRGQRT